MSSVRGLVARMPMSLLAFVFIEVVSSRTSFGVFLLLQLSLSSPSVPLQVLELSCPSPAGTDSQSHWGRPLTRHLTRVARAVTISES